MELLASSRSDTIATHLSLADHVRNPDPGQDNARTAEIREPHHRLDDVLDGAVVLLDGIVQVFVLPNLDRRWSLSSERPNGGQISAALVHRDRFGLAVLINRFSRSNAGLRPCHDERAAGNQI